LLGGWDDHDITSGGSTVGSTDLAHEHVGHGVLVDWLGLSSEESSTDESNLLGPSSTVVGSPVEALDSISFDVEYNLNFVGTSGLEEWDHSREVETVVVSDWSGSSGDEKFDTSRESDGTIVTSRFTGSGSLLVGVHWETVRNLHVSISDGGLDSDVEMEESLHSSWSSGTGGHLPEDITELLSRRSESTSTSDSGQMSWHIHDSLEFEGDWSVIFIGVGFWLESTMGDSLVLLGSEELKSVTRLI
jgi:hypothetical protein